MRTSLPLASATALLAIGLAAGLVSGCADGAPGIGATPSPSPVAKSSGPLADPDSPRRIVYDERLVSDPLPASTARTARSSMTAENAIEVATRQMGKASDLRPGTPAASLRLVYSGRPDGAQRVAGKPSWLLTWRDSAPAVRGPVTMSDEERRKIADSLECVFVVTVDPAKRIATNSVQLCERR